MVAVLDDLGLRELVTTIARLTSVGATAILAETGDPARFASPRSLVSTRGCAPRQRFWQLPGQDLDSGRGPFQLRIPKDPQSGKLEAPPIICWRRLRNLSPCLDLLVTERRTGPHRGGGEPAGCCGVPDPP